MTCARVAVGTATPADLERAARATADWPLVLQQSVDHRMSSLLHKQLAALASARAPGPSLCPPEAAERLLAVYRAGVQRGLFMTTQLIHLLDLFATHDIPALPFKGPVLAVQAYGDPGLRSCIDLDVLVPRARMAHATELLLADGFTRSGAWPQQYDGVMLRRVGHLGFDDPSGNFLVEVHDRVGSALELTSIPAEHLLARAREVGLLARTVSAPGSDDTLLILCVHGARHEWGCLEMVVTAGRVIQAMTDGQWQGFLDDARRWKSLRRALLGARVVTVALNQPLPAVVEAELARDPRAESLARSALAHLRCPRGKGLSADVCSAVWMSLTEDTGNRAAEHLLRQLLAPGPGDWRAFHFGPRLTPLYWPLRPVRVAAYAAKVALNRRARIP